MGKQVKNQSMDLTKRENVERYLTHIRNENFSNYNVSISKLREYGVRVCEDINWLKSFLTEMPEKYKIEALDIIIEFKDKYSYLVNFLFVNQNETDLYYMTLRDMIRNASVNLIVNIAKLDKKRNGNTRADNKPKMGKKALHLCNVLTNRLNNMIIQSPMKNLNEHMKDSVSKVNSELTPALQFLNRVVGEINILNKDVKLKYKEALTQTIEDCKLNYTLKCMCDKQTFINTIVSAVNKLLSSKSKSESSLCRLAIRRILSEYLLLIKFSNKDKVEKRVLSERYLEMCNTIVNIINQAVGEINNKTEETEEKAMTEEKEETNETAKGDLKTLTKVIQYLNKYSNYEDIKGVMKSLTQLQCELIEKM